MRRILLMVFALAMFMGLATTAAQAESNSGPGKKCTYGAWSSGKCKPKPKDCAYGMKENGKCKPKPEECKYGVTADHQCMPKPEECKYGMTSDHKCKPKPPECPYGKDDDDRCKPPPVVVPPPEEGVCAKSDLVLLEDLLKGTGALLCLYLGDNAENANADKDCEGSLLALPIQPLVGVCLFLPPADVGGAGPDVEDKSMGTPLKLTSGGPLSGLVSMLTGLFKLA
jgi:hypothetical protein